MTTSQTKSKDLKLYIKAREAYYNGEEIMPDAEFDALEKKLGMENRLIGAPSTSNNYTVPHPFIMGSLKKIQVHQTSDWGNLYEQLPDVLKKHSVIVTPKYDGCSFEMVIKHGQLFSVSTRGDGNWGKDIYHLMKTMLTKHPINFKVFKAYECFILRGEILIEKDTFERKYAKEFKNPRSFVSGMVNSDYDVFNKAEFKKASDLEYVIYDYRYIKGNKLVDLDDKDLASLIGKTDIPYPETHIFSDGLLMTSFKEIYKTMVEFRSKYKFPLDGFVIKPCSNYREPIPAEYPNDCIAIKFEPMVAETTVVNIHWNLGKSREYYPTLQVEPVVLDGKTITNVSGHNYGFIIDKTIGIGSKIVISLAGDIIPFIYKVKTFGETLPLPDWPFTIKDCHAYADLSKEQDVKNRFLNSCEILSIPGLGPALSEQLYDYVRSNCKVVCSNILRVKPKTIKMAIPTLLGEKISAEFKNILENITLAKVIQTMCLDSHGPKVCSILERIILTGEGKLPNYKTEWVLSEDSKEFRMLRRLLHSIGKKLKYFHLEESNQILCILTGSPKQYKTKAEFLNAHKEYKETSSFKEAKVVFTGDLNSTSSKMMKAKKLGITIKEY
jgi:NAD-dependent DNA ligase